MLFKLLLTTVSLTQYELQAGGSGLVVGRPTAMREDPGSNLTAAGRVYHDSHCGTGCAPLLQCLGRLSLPPSVGR